MPYKKSLKAASALIVLGLFSGCATMDANQCAAADWYSIGLTDGAAGKELGHLDSHRRACAKHGIRTDGIQYSLGHEAGVPSYCTRTQGFTVGKRGYGDGAVCKGAMLDTFNEGFLLGRDLYEERRELSRVNSEIEVIEDELVSGNLSRDERVLHLRDLRDLERTAGRLEERVIAIEHEARVSGFTP